MLITITRAEEARRREHLRRRDQKSISAISHGKSFLINELFKSNHYVRRMPIGCIYVPINQANIQSHRPQTVGVYLLLHNRYICYIVIVIISIIHGSDRPRETEREGEKERKRGKQRGKQQQRKNARETRVRAWYATAPHNSHVTPGVKMFSRREAARRWSRRFY